MTTVESLASVSPEQRFGLLWQQAVAARTMLERAWTPETAYQNITLSPEDASSRGQCGVSITWFSRFLTEQGVDVRWTEGKIHLLSGEGDEHVWAEVHGITESPLVIDLTSDQYPTPRGSRLHIGQYADTDEIIGRYTAEAQFHPFDIPHKKMMARVAILENNIAQLPWWQRLRVK